jgi:hypothetical protein
VSISEDSSSVNDEDNNNRVKRRSFASISSNSDRSGIDAFSLKDPKLNPLWIDKMETRSDGSHSLFRNGMTK